MSKKLIIFTDIGDTIIDEGTEIRKVPGGIVEHAQCIPEAKETMLSLYEDGYSIVMVADGLTKSFHNTMNENGLSHIFSKWIISEEVGAEKPSFAMFETALKEMNLTDDDKKRIVMIGNNLERDIVGANRFGIRSIHLQWSNRYSHQPKNREEEPDFIIQTPSELIPLIQKLEASL